MSTEEDIRQSDVYTPAPAPQSSPPNSGSAESTATLGAGNATSPLSLLLSNPALMEKLPDIMTAVKPLLAGISLPGSPEKPQTTSEPTAGTAAAPASAPTETPPPPSAAPSAAPSAVPTGNRPSPPPASAAHSQRAALLKALHPYMSRGRQDAIDYMLRIDQLGKLFRQP